jgi:hypothetical protein
VVKCLFALICITPTLSSAWQDLTVTGTAVAISHSPGMQLVINGFVRTEIVVRVDKPNNLETRFIRIMLSIPDTQYEKWMNSLTSLTKFRIVRRNSEDGPLIQSSPILDASSGEEIGSFPAWRHLPGRADIQLPFGQKVIAFESVEWPDVPIL